MPATPRSSHVGGRGKSASVDLARKLFNRCQSEESLRKKLRARGFLKSRISQLLAAVVPARGASVRKKKSKSRSFAQDLVKKLHNNGLSDEHVRSRLRLRGYRKSRISQLMTIYKNSQLVCRSSANTLRAKLTRPVKAASQEADSSLDIEDIIEAAVAKSVPALSVHRTAGHVGRVGGSRHSVSGMDAIIRDNKSNRSRFAKDPVQKLRSQGPSKERVQSKIGLRGSQVVGKKGSLMPASSVNTARARQSRPLKAVAHVQPARKPYGKVDSSVDVDRIVEIEAAKRASASSTRRSAGHVGTVKGNRHCKQSMAALPSKIRAAPGAVRAPPTLKRARLQPEQDGDIESVIRAEMMKKGKTSLAKNTNASAPVASHSGIQANVSISQVQGVPDIGSEDSATAAARINALNRGKFASADEWGFAVLCQPARDVLSVQKAYRAFMRCLHPDKAGTDPAIVGAVELLREAASICEKSLRRQEVPGRPTQVKWVCSCSEPGKRQVQIVWTAPKQCESAPIHKYIVAVLDPSFGEVLTIANLETDYCDVLKRYLHFDDPELCSYVISEEDLRKMPKLFKVDWLTVHIAAVNREGQSDWSTVKVNLRKLQVP